MRIHVCFVVVQILKVLKPQILYLYTLLLVSTILFKV